MRPHAWVDPSTSCVRRSIDTICLHVCPSSFLIIISVSQITFHWQLTFVRLFLPCLTSSSHRFIRVYAKTLTARVSTTFSKRSSVTLSCTQVFSDLVFSTECHQRFPNVSAAFSLRSSSVFQMFLWCFATISPSFTQHFSTVSSAVPHGFLSVSVAFP